MNETKWICLFLMTFILTIGGCCAHHNYLHNQLEIKRIEQGFITPTTTFSY